MARKPKPKRHKARAKVRRAAPSAIRYAESREGALLYSVLEREGKKKVSESAILFLSVLSNLTPAVSTLSRRAGMHAGRCLYSILRNRRRYLLYEESARDLVRFFEHAGYPWITYNVFPDHVSMQMRDRSHEYIGMNLHGFETGIISGFFTAVKRQHVPITEQECSNNGAPQCTFASAYSEAKLGDSKDAITRFVEHAAMQLKKKEAQAELKVAPEYYALLSSPILERQYLGQMCHVALYVGSEIGDRLFPNGKASTGKAAIALVERAIHLLNLGKISVKSLKPISIAVSFDSMHSKGEFVDLSVAFLNGLLKGHDIESARVTRLMGHGTYRVTIAGRQKKR